jgi:CubicO group peptidase (beta-lactamase class C family)
MRKFAFLFIASLIASFSDFNDLTAQIGFPIDKTISQSTIDSLKKYALTYPNGTQFSMAIIKNGIVNFIGLSKRNGELVSINNRDSVFEIGSLTKIFTSTILVNLILQDKINPDEPISQTLPFKLSQSEKDGKSITYKMLSNHTSGIPSVPDSIDEYIKKNPENPWTEFDNKKFKDYLQTNMKLNFTPGSMWDYSNLGAALLGYLIEIKTSQPFETLLQTIVFSKYDMPSTTTDRTKIKNRLVKGHNDLGIPVLNWDCNAIASAGACLSTSRDLSKFVLANFSNDSILSYQRQRTFNVENNNLDIAYAWHIYRKNGIVWYFHNGGTGGYQSNITMDLTKKCAIIMLTNSTFEPQERYLEKVSWKILRTL